MLERKAAAEETFRRNQEALRQQKIKEEALRSEAQISGFPWSIFFRMEFG